MKRLFTVFCVLLLLLTGISGTVVFAKSGAPVKITSQPTGASAYLGDTVKTTVKARGDGLKYQWYFSRKGETKFTKSTIKAATYAVKMTKARDSLRVYCVVKDKYGNTVKTKTVTLTMRKQLKITTQPKSASAVMGDTVKATVKAQGDGLQYQWYFARKGETKFTKSTIKTATYAVKMTKARDGLRVYCVVKDKYGSTVKTKTVTLAAQTYNPKTVVGTWTAHKACIQPRDSYYKFDKATLYVYSDGSAKLRVEKNNLFDSGTFVLYYYYQSVKQGVASYNIYSDSDGMTEDMTGTHDSQKDELLLRFKNGSYIAFVRK